MLAEFDQSWAGQIRGNADLAGGALGKRALGTHSGHALREHSTRPPMKAARMPTQAYALRESSMAGSWRVPTNARQVCKVQQEALAL